MSGRDFEWGIQTCIFDSYDIDQQAKQKELLRHQKKLSKKNLRFVNTDGLEALMGSYHLQHMNYTCLYSRANSKGQCGPNQKAHMDFKQQGYEYYKRYLVGQSSAPASTITAMNFVYRAGSSRVGCIWRTFREVEFFGNGGRTGAASGRHTRESERPIRGTRRPGGDLLPRDIQRVVGVAKAGGAGSAQIESGSRYRQRGTIRFPAKAHGTTSSAGDVWGDKDVGKGVRVDYNSEMDRVAGKCVRQRDASGCVRRTDAHMPGSRKEDMGGGHERGVFAADEEFGTGRKSVGEER